jgi:hypothetical protein
VVEVRRPGVDQPFGDRERHVRTVSTELLTRHDKFDGDAHTAVVPTLARATLAAVAAGCTLMGCAVPVASRSATGRNGPPVKAAQRCTKQDGSFNLHRRSGALPAGLHARAVVLCQVETRTRPDTSEWDYVVTKRATSGLDAFVAALREPDDPASGGACAAVGHVDPVVVVVDVTGVGYRPAFPRDGCGLLKPDATKALAALPFRVSDAVPLQQVRSALSGASGCADEWKDVLALEGARAGAGQPPLDRQRVLVCVYLVHPPQRVLPNGSTDRVVAGGLTAGRRLSLRMSSRLLRAIAHAPAPPGCAERHTRFAVVTGAHLAAPVYLELDGCRRLSSWTGDLLAVTSEIAGLVDID